MLGDDANGLSSQFDVVVDATGSNSGFDAALDLVKPCGKLVLKTWYGGELTINRSAIKSLSPGFSAAKMIFDGPNFAKFRVGRDGTVLARFDPRTKPDDDKVVGQLQEALKAPRPEPVEGAEDADEIDAGS